MEEPTYYSLNKSHMDETAKLYKLKNKKKIKAQQKLYRTQYNKLNYYCKSCKKIFLLSSKKRHIERKHTTPPSLIYI